MATNEEILNPVSLVLPQISGQNILTAPTGMIAMSGAKIVFFDGTIFKTVTS